MLEQPRKLELSQSSRKRKRTTKRKRWFFQLFCCHEYDQIIQSDYSLGTCAKCGKSKVFLNLY